MKPNELPFVVKVSGVITARLATPSEAAAITDLYDKAVVFLRGRKIYEATSYATAKQMRDDIRKAAGEWWKKGGVA